MTNNITVLPPREIEHLEECPFDLVPGADGRWLMWWAEEKTWIASFPSLEVAQRFIIGDPYEMPYNPGWDRSRVAIDVQAALYRQWEETGKCPQFEFNETSNIFDLYVPLGLGLEALARHIYYDASCYEVCQQLIDEFCPLVARCLSGGDWGLEAETVDRVVPIVTELLLRQTRLQQRLAMSFRLSRLKASKVRNMNAKELKNVVGEYALDVDISKLDTIDQKADAVIARLLATRMLKGWKKTRHQL